MLINNKTIAIIGGGPGGLTLARLLQMQGANVKVYEWDINKHVRVQGATLDLHEESGLQALRECGLMAAFKENYRPGADRVRVLDKHANILADQHEPGSRHYENTRPEIDRGPLRHILLESLAPDTVVWNSKFKFLRECNAGWQIEFENGASVNADIVIAADGANSRVRPFITAVKPFFAGITAIEGTVYESAIATPNLHQLLKGGKIFAFGDDKTIIASAKGDGSLSFYLGCKTEENWCRHCGIDFNDKAQALTWFTQAFPGWSNIWYELLQQAAQFVLRPQYCMPLDQCWDSLPNLTMLGDAAHLMPPYAGEGVNMAMLDALELSQCLTAGGFQDIRSAIAHYEKQMRSRASAAAAATLESSDLLHSSAAITFMTSIIG